MDPQRGLPFDPLRDHSRDPYLRSIGGSRDVLGHTPSQQAMTLATNLSSGQGFYTVESLEGATSLPLPKPAPPLPRPETYPASVALGAERDALLRIDARTRALLADKDSLDARARLLAAEREALLRALPGESETRARVLPDGLQHLDARARDGLHLDPRARALSVVDSRPRAIPDGLQPLGLQALGLQLRDARARAFPDGLDLPSRVPPLTGGFTLKGRDRLPPPELLPPRGLGAGAREGLPPFLSSDLMAAAPLPHRESLELRGRHENLELRGRTESIELRGRQDNLELHGRRTARSLDWVSANGKRKADGRRPDPLENFRVRKQVVKGKPSPSSNHPPRAGLDQKSPAVKTKPAPKEPDGWCAVCKVNCVNAKNLEMHFAGKKHKLVLEQLNEDKANIGNAGEAVKTLAEREAKAARSEKGATSLADRKRANDEKVENPQNAKRPKASAAADASNKTAAAAAAADAKKGYENEARPVCKLCNISCTGKVNLDSHLKGKKHAARVKEITEASSGQK